jgi:amidase
MGDYEGYLPTEQGVLDVCTKALQRIADAGAIVEACQPDYEIARLWQTWLTFRHWTLGDAKELYDNPEMRRQLKPEFVWEIEGSFDMPAARVASAGLDRSDWYRALLTLFETYDILALPTAQVFPFSKSIHWPTEVAGKAMDTYHRWMEVVIGGTLSGLPVVNLPAGFDASGRPMGMQFIGRMGEDKAVMEFALAYENSTEFLDRRPAMREPAAL